MSDVGEDYAAMKEVNREHREELGDERMEYARKKLGALGCDLEPGPDPKSFTVQFPDGPRFHFWPYSGWFNRIGGPGNGRGIATLIRKAKEVGGKAPIKEKDEPDTRPDWTGSCEVCGQSPVVPVTGLCGPCTFGEAETLNGNW